MGTDPGTQASSDLPGAQASSQTDESIPEISVHLTHQFPIPDFFTAEDLGIRPLQSCSRCQNCTDCDFRRQNITREQLKVVEKQESLMTLDKANKCIETSYAWTENVHDLKDNRGQAIAFQRSIEKKLIKDNELDLYNEEVKKVVEKEHLRKMSPDEIARYTGPVSYVSHFPVYKDSKTTPIRLATNTSLKNKSCGLSPNECMGDPPNALSSLITVFLRWRTYEVALNLDLTKAYQSVKTPGLLEQNVRRLVWRWGDKDQEWEIYCWMVMTFGDQLAALILELAKNIAADEGRDEDPEAVEILITSTYVDDLCGGGTQAQVDRFKGTKLPDGSYSGTLPRILSNVGLNTKVVVQSGETDKDALDMFGNKVLGHGWDPTLDKLIFEFVVNLSAKNCKGERLEPNLTQQDISTLSERLLTKRRLLGLVMSQFDPTGLLSPITIKLKIQQSISGRLPDLCMRDKKNI